MMLEVDLKGLAGFSSVQPAGWQNEFFSRLTPSLQKAVRANMAFSSRAEQMTLAQRGHNELVEAVKRRVAQGAVSFSELVA
jgi:DNA-binding FadR family transcriptional regulator